MQRIHILFALALLAAVVAACVSTAGATPSTTSACPSTEPFVGFTVTATSPSVVTVAGQLVDCNAAPVAVQGTVEVEIRAAATDGPIAWAATQGSLLHSEATKWATLKTDATGAFAATLTNTGASGSAPIAFETFVRLGKPASLATGAQPVCNVSAQFVRTCTQDADCGWADRTLTCCGHKQAQAYATSQASAFAAAEATCQAICAGYTCPSVDVLYTDDYGTPEVPGKVLVTSCHQNTCMVSWGVHP